MKLLVGLLPAHVLDTSHISVDADVYLLLPQQVRHEAVELVQGGVALAVQRHRGHGRVQVVPGTSL